MPRRETYLVRHVSSGKMASIQAYSVRGAAEIYGLTPKYRQLINQYTKLEGRPGRDVAVKLRGGSNDWSVYRVQ